MFYSCHHQKTEETQKSFLKSSNLTNAIVKHRKADYLKRIHQHMPSKPCHLLWRDDSLKTRDTKAREEQKDILVRQNKSAADSQTDRWMWRGGSWRVMTESRDWHRARPGGGLRTARRLAPREPLLAWFSLLLLMLLLCFLLGSVLRRSSSGRHRQEDMRLCNIYFTSVEKIIAYKKEMLCLSDKLISVFLFRWLVPVRIKASKYERNKYTLMSRHELNPHYNLSLSLVLFNFESNSQSWKETYIKGF